MTPLFCRFVSFVLLCSLTLFQQTSHAQVPIPLNDFSFFKAPQGQWKIAGDVHADLQQNGRFVLKEGVGVLVNMPVSGEPAVNLMSAQDYGDTDIEFDFMMAKGSNSGVYVQGRYEIQLLDSWGVVNPRSADVGGIYERWDESRPAGQKGYEGHAPRQNVSKAPGLWQHLKIVFQAPRFSGSQKIENARFLRVELNGILIHENVELFGATRGGMDGEVAAGPLLIQGDHGAVAFKNFRLSSYVTEKPSLQNLQYEVYKGPVNKITTIPGKAKPMFTGFAPALTTNIDNLPDTFILRYTGVLKILQPGKYNFNFVTVAGNGVLTINNQKSNLSGRRGVFNIDLPTGELPFELAYIKTMDWGTPSFTLTMTGPGLREFPLTETGFPGGAQIDPILIDAQANTLIRSFVDIPGMRVVHAVSVGSPRGLHYTYDIDNGAVVQIWRGGFLDATPMWHERGDGSSRPRGAVQLLGKPELFVQQLSSPQDVWRTNAAEVGFRPKGYELDEHDLPTFHYIVYGKRISDKLRVLANGQGIQREVAVNEGDSLNGLFARLAVSSSIEDMGNGLYLLEDHSYYIQLDASDSGKAVIRNAGNKKELLLPVKNKLSYTLLL